MKLRGKVLCVRCQNKSYCNQNQISNKYISCSMKTSLNYQEACSNESDRKQWVRRYHVMSYRGDSTEPWRKDELGAKGRYTKIPGFIFVIKIKATQGPKLDHFPFSDSKITHSLSNFAILLCNRANIVMDNPEDWDITLLGNIKVLQWVGEKTKYNSVNLA